MDAVCGSMQQVEDLSRRSELAMKLLDGKACYM